MVRLRESTTDLLEREMAGTVERLDTLRIIKQAIPQIPQARAPQRPRQTEDCRAVKKR